LTKEQLEFISRFKNARVSKHLTIKELANLSQVSACEISWIETGRTYPKMSTLQKIAKALNISIKYLKGE